MISRSRFAFVALLSSIVALACSSDPTPAATPDGAGSAGTIAVAGGGSSSGLAGTSAGGAPSNAGANAGGASAGSAGINLQAGASGASGGADAAGAGSSEPSGMPLPTTNGVAKPNGAAGNLKILDWAGFKAAVSFTFDDALTSQIANYAALNAPGVPLTFYLVSNNNGTSNTWSTAAKDGHELGNHTAHHCHDTGMGCAWGTYAGSLSSELDQCSMHLEQQFQVSDVWTTASPYGDAGYQSAASGKFLLNRGVQGGSVGANDNTNPFSLPCHTASQGELAASFDAATDAARNAGKWQLFLIHSLGGDGGYNPVAVSDVVAAITHAKLAGDTWADSVVHVGAYWRAQKLIGALSPATSGSDKTWTWTLPAHFPPGRYVRVKVDGGTLSQGGAPLVWSSHGYYEVELDKGSLKLCP